GPFTPAPMSLDQLGRAGANPLLAAGGPLIALANSLRSVTDGGDVVRLRRTVVDELRRFQARTRELVVGDDDARYGHYVLCALIDEVVLSTPWGVKSSWGQQTLVATFHNEVVSGDRMFELADALEARPGRSPNLLELIYVCLSFGFEGRMRLERGGASRLVQLRERLYAAIRNLKGPVERELSPHWAGVDASYVPLSRQTPLWVWLSGFAVLLLALYAALALRLAGLSERAAAPLTASFRAGPAELNRSAPAPAADSRLYLSILDILKPDIDAGRVAVTDEPDAVQVRMKDKGLFASGSADLDASYDPTMGRIAQAIALTHGSVAVTGHTDTQRVASLRFTSNQALSEARAAAVVSALGGKGVEAARLAPSGVGETQPVADNGDEAGRRQNRRVEVTIPKSYNEGGAR
uniref:type VI secretion system protein TssL, long form n=1 Tax=Sphingomonas bacterium TaxID=1895847 RepID=UPI0015776C55